MKNLKNINEGIAKSSTRYFGKGDELEAVKELKMLLGSDFQVEFSFKTIQIKLANVDKLQNKKNTHDDVDWESYFEWEITAGAFGNFGAVIETFSLYGTELHPKSKTKIETIQEAVDAIMFEAGKIF